MLEQVDLAWRDAAGRQAIEHLSLTPKKVADVAPIQPSTHVPARVFEHDVDARLVVGRPVHAATVGMPDCRVSYESLPQQYGLRKPLVWRSASFRQRIVNPKRRVEPRRRPIGHERAGRGPEHRLKGPVVSQHRRLGEDAVAVVHQASRSDRPIGQDRRAGQSECALMECSRKVAELLVVVRVCGYELSGRRAGAATVSERGDIDQRGREFERAPMLSQHGHNPCQNGRRREHSCRHV